MTEYIESLIRKAKETFNIAEGDYIGDDNLYYCGKCKTPKQTIITMRGQATIVPCVCKCRAEEIKAEEEAIKQTYLSNRIMQMRIVCFPERSMRDWNFNNDNSSNPMMTNAMKNFVEQFQVFREEGKGLLLFGTVGTGKTYLAAAAANALIDKFIPCLVTNLERIANEVQGTFEKQQYYDYINSFPLLVIDDLGSERKTEYMQEVAYNVIDMRYRSKLPIIVTTNLTREELLNSQDFTYKRIFSRLFEMCMPIEVLGKDKRQQALIKDIGNTKILLGLE